MSRFLIIGGGFLLGINLSFGLLFIGSLSQKANQFSWFCWILILVAIAGLLFLDDLIAAWYKVEVRVLHGIAIGLILSLILGLILWSS
ncbi:MAG TPA: hypothetical protein DCQ51_13410 [Planktothrix sp. UBA8407]|jgi:hypothetical protein|nr:hypothetical protein [Planktothrix sp. UBA8407]